MSELTFTENYITNIPWKYNPGLCNTNDPELYAEAFKNVLEIIPDTENKIKFSDDIWDFRPYYKDINNRSYKILFINADKDYINYLKSFVIYQISQKSKISTIERRVSDFIQIISGIKTQKEKPFSTICTDDITNYIDNLNCGSQRRNSLYVCSYQIYSFIIKNHHFLVPVSVEALISKSVSFKKKSKVEQEKIPNIPQEYFDIIVDTALSVLKNNLIDYNTRMTAGLIIIASQSGLRIQDLLGIKVDGLKQKYLPSFDTKCYYLHYQARKPSKAHSKMLEFDIYANGLCADAFIEMSELRKQCEFSNEEYLYVLDSVIHTTDAYPITVSRFRSEYKRFFFKFLLKESQMDWKGIKKVKYSRHLENNSSKKVEYLSVPAISQYRVHLATSLYNRGVSLPFIQRYFGHLSEYMLGYYVRPKDKSPENAKFAESVIKKIAGDNVSPIGQMGDELKDGIKKFIDEGHYNVETDSSKIVNDLGEKLVIREKGPGLCCIKTSIIPCKYDGRTDAVLCAYGMCPNIYHFYDSIDYTYRQFRSMQNTYQQNLDNGFTIAARKELNKIKNFIRKRLNTELAGLKSEIRKAGGTDAFCNLHPDLIYYVEHYDEIKKEGETWEKY